MVLLPTSYRLTVSPGRVVPMKIGRAIGGDVVAHDPRVGCRIEMEVARRGRCPNEDREGNFVAETARAGTSIRRRSLPTCMSGRAVPVKFVITKLPLASAVVVRPA